MSKVIVSGGCSFAYGFNLKDRNKKYASLVAEKIDAELVDVAVSGSSNENIAASVAYGLNTALKKYKPQDIIVIIGWTETARMEYWNKHIARIQSCFMTPFLPSDKDFLDKSKTKEIKAFVFDNMWEPCYTYYRLLHAFNYIHNLCRSRGVKTLHIKNLDIVKARMPSGLIINAAMRGENYTNDVLSQEDAEVFNLMVGSTSFRRFLFNLYERSTQKYLPGELLIDPIFDHHPSELGHRLWAEEIINKHQHILLS